MPATSQPFGDDAVTTGGCAVASPDFLTGKPRDAESGLDDFGARYLSSQWGRWMSADWTAGASAVPYATLTNPQSLNLYAYVGNDPVDGMDADGHARYDHGCGAYLSMCALLAADGDGVSSSSSSGDEAYLDSTLEQNTEHASDDEHDSETPASHIPKPLVDKRKTSFWSHIGNLLHGHSWNYKTRESGEGFVVWAGIAGRPAPMADPQAVFNSANARPARPPTPRYIPREVPGPDPVGPQSAPGEIPEIGVGASALERLGIGALNAVSLMGQVVTGIATDILPPMYINRDVLHLQGNGCSTPDCAD